MRPLTANTRDLMMHDFRTKPDNLDPDDWQNFRSISHDALSLMIDFIATIRERPVWTQAPAAAIEQFHQPLPLMPHDCALFSDRRNKIDHQT